MSLLGKCQVKFSYIGCSVFCSPRFSGVSDPFAEFSMKTVTENKQNLEPHNSTNSSDHHNDNDDS